MAYVGGFPSEIEKYILESLNAGTHINRITGDAEKLQTPLGVCAPIQIPHDFIFTIPSNQQVMYQIPIINDGLLVIDGFLIEI